MPLVFAIKAKNHENNNNSNVSKTTRALIYRPNICILYQFKLCTPFFDSPPPFPHVLHADWIRKV